jgi:plasminogen activator inhibitor 1 RNA-binding protein
MFALLNDSDEEGEDGAAKPAATKDAPPKAEAPKKALTENKARPEDKKKVPTKTKDEETPSYGSGDRGGRASGGRGGPGDRGGRGGPRPPREGKREYDRHSGTGRPPTENKREGRGKYNWGADGDAGEGSGPVEKEERELTKEELEEIERRRAEKELEDKQMTLEEYQAKVAKENEGKGLAAVGNIRVAEGGMEGVALERPDDDEGYASKGKFRQKKTKDSKAIDTGLLGFQSAPHEVPDSGKGKGRKGDKGTGRGYSAGRGASTGGRGGRGKSSGPEANIDFGELSKSMSAFPSLG